MTVFLHLTLALYALAFIKYMLYLFFRRDIILRFGIGITVLGILSNTVLLFLRSLETGHGPYFSTFDYFIFFPWLIAIIFLVVEYKHKIKDLGSFILPIILVVFSFAYITPDSQNELVKAPLWSTLHRTLYFVGYAHFGILFGVSIMYLLQEYQIKKKNFGGLYQRLPSLEVLDNVNHKALIFGFTLYTLGFVTGSISSATLSEDGAFIWKLQGTLPLVAIWTIFAGLFVSRIVFGFRRKPFAKWSIAASVAVIIALYQHIQLY